MKSSTPSQSILLSACPRATGRPLTNKIVTKIGTRVRPEMNQSPALHLCVGGTDITSVAFDHNTDRGCSLRLLYERSSYTESNYVTHRQSGITKRDQERASFPRICVLHDEGCDRSSSNQRFRREIGEGGFHSPTLLAATPAAPSPLTPRHAKNAALLCIKEATREKAPYVARPTEYTDLRPVKAE